MNKKGDMTTEEVISLTVAVLVLVVLLTLATYMYFTLTQNLENEQAKDSLDRINSSLTKLKLLDLKSVDVFIESPYEWAILAWPYRDYIYEGIKTVPAQCEDHCICICPIPHIDITKKEFWWSWDFGASSAKVNFFSNCENDGLCLNVESSVKTIDNVPEFSWRDKVLDVFFKKNSNIPISIMNPINVKIYFDGEVLILEKSPVSASGEGSGGGGGSGW